MPCLPFSTSLISYLRVLSWRGDDDFVRSHKIRLFYNRKNGLLYFKVSECTGLQSQVCCAGNGGRMREKFLGAKVGSHKNTSPCFKSRISFSETKSSGANPIFHQRICSWGDPVSKLSRGSGA